jgi:uncharacterized Zn ribbon protein
MGFKIDFSEEDLNAKGTSTNYDALPAGDYPCVVSDIELKEVSQGENKGKLMWKVTLTVEDDDKDAKYNGRKFWPSIMLFTVYDKKTGKPNNFYMAQWLKATDMGHAMEAGEVPEAEVFLGKKLIANVIRKKSNYNVVAGDPPKFENAVKGFMPLNAETVATAKGKKTNSLLP